MNDGQSDASLVRRARQGDASAWRALVRRHTPMIYRLALRTLRQEADAEDATQEVFVRMNRHLEQYDPTRPLPAWLGKITYNVCLTRLGQRRELPSEPETLEALSGPSFEEGADASIAARQSHAAVVRAVDQLPAEDRFLVTMRYRDDQSDVAVAEATGMNVNTVRTRLFRARQALRRLLTRGGPDDQEMH